MKSVFNFLINNWDLITTLLFAIITRAVEKPIIEKQAKIQVLDSIIDEATKPDDDGKSKSVGAIVFNILNRLKSRKNGN
jgi:hypothetical protein